jgi:predicted SnoaL-like aldol condensation-catalyzing enzyme
MLLDKKTMNNKELALAFLKLIISGQIDEAYSKYVDLEGKHHNVYFPKGFPSLRDALKENHLQFPNKQFYIKRAIAEGEMVAVHSNVILAADKNIAVVHLFRFRENKIVEMWDCGQMIPADSPNQDGAF